ncbi:MAG: RNA polymerase sporulation sigma factor SigH [Armatimonadetes bacterium]|nr:RNA polymerase sporulation sigma factor SigH [Armatimonadota bacterium]
MSLGFVQCRYQKMADEEVADRARHGEPEASEYLVNRYRGLVESKARSYFLHGADKDDVIQEGMIGLCKAIRDYRQDRSTRFRPFAELCISRQIISAVKTATRHKHALLNGSTSLSKGINEDGTETTLLDVIPDRNAVDPEQAMIEGQFPHRLAYFVKENLSPLEQGVFSQYLAGRSYKEIGEEFHCQPKSIDNALQRAKKKLGTLLEE